MQIFIPTRGRVDKQLTRERAFLDELPYPVNYIVPECEKHFWGEMAEAIPDDWNISRIRQYILETFTSDPFHVVIDDDLRFARRVPGGTTLRNSTKEDILEMFQWVENTLSEGWVHGGISPRFCNVRRPDDVEYNTRILRFHFYNRDFVSATGFKFTDIASKQDFHFTLSMLEAGYPNIQCNLFTHDQNDSNQAGGCSRYRTPQHNEETSRRLAELHPGVVRVVEKTTATAWGGGTRIDVIVSWKKALKQ